MGQPGATEMHNSPDPDAAPARKRRSHVLRDFGLVLLALLIAVGGHVLWASRHMSVEVTRAALVVHGDLLGPTLPLVSLRAADARVVDPRSDPASAVVRAVFGGGFAGYRSGWFRLADGTKALVFLREGERALRVPTRGGYSVMVSSRDPERLLDTLRQRYNWSRD